MVEQIEVLLCHLAPLLSNLSVGASLCAYPSHHMSDRVREGYQAKPDYHQERPNVRKRLNPPEVLENLLPNQGGQDDTDDSDQRKATANNPGDCVKSAIIQQWIKLWEGLGDIPGLERL